MDWIQQRGRSTSNNLRRKVEDQSASQTFVPSLSGGNMPGMYYGPHTASGDARQLSQVIQQGTQNMQPYQNYIDQQLNRGQTNYGAMPNNVHQWQNPYAGMMQNQLTGMGNAQNAQQGANAYLGFYGGGWNALQQNNPQFAQYNYNPSEMNPNLVGFLNQQSGRDVYAPASLGIGGNIAASIAGGAMPNAVGNYQGIDPSQTATARNTQLSSLLGLSTQPAFSDAELDAITRGATASGERALREGERSGMSNLSSRGLGRSTAVSQLLGNTQDNLRELYGGVAGQLAQQNAAMRNQNRLSAISGLGEFAGTGINAALQGQGLANQYALGQGNLGMGLAGLTQSGQEAANQMNYNARGQQFGENQTRAGMLQDMYNTENANQLQNLMNLRSTDLSQQGMLQSGQNAANQNMLSLLGMGQQGAAQDFSQQNALLSGLLNAGNQNQNAWQTYQQQLLGQEGQRGGLDLQQQAMLNNLANSMYGQQYGQSQDMVNLLEGMRRYNQDYDLQKKQLEAQSKGGGLGGLLGGIGGTLLGSALGPIGSAIGGKIGSSLFGGGGSTGGSSFGSYGGGYSNPVQLYNYGYGSSGYGVANPYDEYSTWGRRGM